MSQGITYELAKQLKDAGFPFISSGPAMDSEKNGLLARNAVLIKRTWYFFPTLSELIEACGEEFDALVASRRSGGWLASNGNKRFGNGATPEEAVTKLWLALHPLSNSKEEV